MKYVARAEAGIGWRIWSRKTGRSWGNYFRHYPEELLLELNGQKRPERLVDLSRDSFTKKESK